MGMGSLSVLGTGAGFAKERHARLAVIPAQAGIQSFPRDSHFLDPGLRRGDGERQPVHVAIFATQYREQVT